MIEVHIVMVPTFLVFHAYLRIEALLRVTDHGTPVAAAAITPRLIVADRWTDGRISLRDAPEHSAVALTLEALVDRDGFPDQADLELAAQGEMCGLPCVALMQAAARAQDASLDQAFRALIADLPYQPGGAARPRMLDIGGRARSGLARRTLFPDCDVTTFDIVADASVDVVGDAHELDRHFPPDSFDVALCVSVFEHLLMPWKAALAMNAVLRTGGIALIHTHQTIGMHDMPWDFWRFSDTAWTGLFNEATGFTIEQASLQSFMHVVARAWTPRFVGSEGSGGFEGSTVIVRKTGPARLHWDVSLAAILPTRYPTGPDDDATPAPRPAPTGGRDAG